MSYREKEQTTGFHPVLAVINGREKTVFNPSPLAPVIQHYRNIGNMAVIQQQKEAPAAMDFSDVKIHANSPKAPAIGAIAYTQGTDIHFAPGAYNPGTSAGRQLIGHELAHVVQQSEGRVPPTGSINGMALNDNPALEAEADAMAKKLV